jgi:hypothetical protein
VNVIPIEAEQNINQSTCKEMVAVGVNALEEYGFVNPISASRRFITGAEVETGGRSPIVGAQPAEGGNRASGWRAASDFRRSTAETPDVRMRLVWSEV